MSNLNSAIHHILLESNDVDVSGKYTLFTLHTDNTATLHLFEDRESYEAMKYKFTSNDNIKRLGASRLPENTTFKQLSENIQHKFGVPRERFTVRTHAPMQEEVQEQPKPQNVSRKPQKPQNSIMESVLKGKERFSTQPKQMPMQEPERTKPTINSFMPAMTQKIDLSHFNNGETPPMLG